MIRVIAILVGWLAVTAPLMAKEPIRARLQLNSQQEWDVELLGRFHTDRVLLKRSGEAGAVELMVTDIRRIEFPLGSKAMALVDLFYARRFAQAAPQLEAVVQPYLLYTMDASSNLDILLRALVKSWYWAGNDLNTLKTCEAILSSTTKGELYTETAAIQVLSRLRQEQVEEAIKAAEMLNAPAVTEPEAAAYWYAMASLQMAQGDLPTAQESLARLISFRSRDPEWMPPGLLLSAEAYARAGQIEVAREIIGEIRLNYPGSSWASKAAKLDLDQLNPAEE